MRIRFAIAPRPSMMALVDTELSPDQTYFHQTSGKFLDARLPSSALRQLRHSEAGFEREYWAQGADLGWTSLLVAESSGGGTIDGAGLVELTLVAHEFGRHAAPGPLLATNVVAGALSLRGTDAQKVALPGILRGETVATWAWAGRRPDDRLGRTGVRAVATGDGWVLSGTALPVEAGAQADLLLVTAASDDGLVQLLVPASAPGVTATPMQGLDLTRRHAAIAFDDVAVPASAVLGEPGPTGDDVERQLQTALVIQTAETVGAMELAFEMTVAWAFDRYSFGRPLASYQALKHRFADMKTWLEASHAIAARAARAVQNDDPEAPVLVSAAKSYIGDQSVELLQECVQLHGGIGVTYDLDLHLYLRRVSQNRMLYGDPAEHRLRITAILEGLEPEQKETS
jgi:alkylation response protein AidB-like acyl-CoA dehydrogenase